MVRCEGIRIRMFVRELHDIKHLGPPLFLGERHAVHPVVLGEERGWRLDAPVSKRSRSSWFRPDCSAVQFMLFICGCCHVRVSRSDQRYLRYARSRQKWECHHLVDRFPSIVILNPNLTDIRITAQHLALSQAQSRSNVEKERKTRTVRISSIQHVAPWWDQPSFLPDG
jgi:hypothetical protein